MTQVDGRTKATDEGFTLVELLVSTAILVIILGAISSALIVFLRTGPYASQRDDHSAGAILLSSYLDRDLASADTVAISTRDASPTSKIASECGGSSEFTLTWRDYTASSAAPVPVASTVYTATYAVAQYNEVFEGISRVRCRLTRTYSSVGGTPDTTVIAENLFNGASSSDTPRAVAATTVAPPTSGSCASTTKFVVSVRQYEGDTASPYSYAGCVKARLI